MGYTRGAMALNVPEPELRTGATIILAVVGIWVLTVLSRPVTRFKALVIGAMFVALLIIFTVPLLTRSSSSWTRARTRRGCSSP